MKFLGTVLLADGEGAARKRLSVIYEMGSSGSLLCAVRSTGLLPVKVPPENWFVPLGSNRSGGGGNKAVGASGVEGRYGDLASMQAVITVGERWASPETSDAGVDPLVGAMPR